VVKKYFSPTDSGKRNPFREQQANLGSERHEGSSEIENDFPWVTSPFSCHVKPSWHFSKEFFRAARMPSASAGDRVCLNFSYRIHGKRCGAGQKISNSKFKTLMI
jgi:hypothetical protein